MVTLSANMAGEDLGRARARKSIAAIAARRRAAARRDRDRPGTDRDDERDVREHRRRTGGGRVVIFLLLAANFQSLRLAFVVVSTVPAVLAGVVVMLLATGTTLNVQSFMGAIMAIGVAVANAILLVTFAEHARHQGGSPLHTAIHAARARMRPVLMTSAAMIAGMIPMALALGEGADATAPLGRAVIGGLAAATLATLIVLPSVYSLVQHSAIRGIAVSRSGRSGERVRRTAAKRMSTRHSSWTIRRTLALGCWLAVGVAGCGGPGAPAPSGEAAAPQTPTIDVVRVVAHPVDVTLDMPGELDPYESVAIFPRVTAFVKTMRVDRGSQVRAGELLAELDAPEMLAQRAEAQSKLQGAQADLAAARADADADRGTYEKLQAASATPGVVAGNDLTLAQKTADAAQSRIAAAEQSVEAARQALNSVTQMEDYLRVTAPFAGVVTERNVHPGALVGPGGGSTGGAPMLRIVNTRRLRLVVPVPEAYVAGVTPGGAIPFTVPAYPGRTFSATVARLAHAIDVKTRTMAVELDVDNADGQLAAGTFCQVRWPVRRPQPSLFVPSASVTSTTGRTFVVRIRDGKTEWIDVRTGLTQGATVEVFGDLQAGDQVAVRGTDETPAGTQVIVKDAAAVS